MVQVYAALLTGFAVMGFWLGTLFISGGFFPETLAVIYRLFPSPWMRMLLILLPVFGTGNLLVAHGFMLSATVSAVVAIVVGTLMPLILAMAVQGIRPNVEITLAIAAVLGAALWLHVALQRLV